MPPLPAPVELVAIDPARNIRRRYAIRIDRNLFGEIEVETSWGRIGARGTRTVARFAAEDEAVRYVGQVLRRRATAPRRIGAAYVALAPSLSRERSTALEGFEDNLEG